jgi:hypothetical protein
MKVIVLWRWRYRDPVRKRIVTTQYLATEDDARAQLPPDAERVEWTREERRVPETQDEAEQLRTGRLAGNPKD